MTTALATSDDGLAWRWDGTVLRPRPGAWDARGARVTAVLAGRDDVLRRPGHARRRTSASAPAASPATRRPGGGDAPSATSTSLAAARRRVAAVLRGAAARRQPRAAHGVLQIAGVSEPRLITAIGKTLPSPARVEAPTRPPFRIAAVQEAWHADAEEHAAALERGIAMAAGEGAKLVCLQELTLSPYFAIVPDALETARRDGRAAPGRPDARARRARGPRARHPRPRLALRAGRGRRAGLQHRDRRRALGRRRGEDAQAPHPGHRRLLRGQVLPRRRRRGGLSGRRARRRPLRLPDLLGPVVPGARPRLLARRRRGDRLPDRDRLRARPPRLRHPAAVGARDHRQRDRQRHVHGRRQPHRPRGRR